GEPLRTHEEARKAPSGKLFPTRRQTPPEGAREPQRGCRADKPLSRTKGLTRAVHPIHPHPPRSAPTRPEPPLHAAGRAAPPRDQTIAVGRASAVSRGWPSSRPA